MKNILAVVVSVVFLTGLAVAQEKMEMKPANHMMTGYLVDQACGSKMAMSDVKKSNAKAARHTKDCALEDACKATGYGLVSGGKFYKFDENGDKQALDYLNATKKENNIKVVVAGTMTGDKFAVASIKDFQAPSMKHKSKDVKPM